MQNELNAVYPDSIYLFAVNEVGLEDSTGEMAVFGDLPLLQDTVEENVWGTWAVTYRDVVILDGEGRRVGVYNLTVNDLSDPVMYAALKTMLEDALNR